MANTQGTRGNLGNPGGNRGSEQDVNLAGHGGNRGNGSHDATPDANRKRSERGFAAMDAERQREIASMGGRAAHRQGTAHEFNSEEARAAGRRGGESVSQNREHMALIGAMGGRASRNGGARAAKNTPSRASDVDRQDGGINDFGLGSDSGSDMNRTETGSGRQGSDSRH